MGQGDVELRKRETRAESTRKGNLSGGTKGKGDRVAKSDERNPECLPVTLFYCLSQ